AAQAQAAASAAAGPAGRPEGSGTQVLVPKNLFSSDLVNRAREASRGLDILSGTPPRPRVQDQSRRRIVVGALERDVPLRMYVDSWRQKIERNGGLNYSQLSTQRVRIDPLVSVAIRSDGSVEEVILIRSTGRAEMDEAVRRIVRVNARYSAFPPNIAAQYDVIEIRRIWNFDDTLKLLEEMR
ncbi:MAG: energy transducer TonB, partial [Telluria sp.]